MAWDEMILGQYESMISQKEQKLLDLIEKFVTIFEILKWKIGIHPGKFLAKNHFRDFLFVMRLYASQVRTTFFQNCSLHEIQGQEFFWSIEQTLSLLENLSYRMISHVKIFNNLTRFLKEYFWFLTKNKA